MGHVTNSVRINTNATDFMRLAERARGPAVRPAHRPRQPGVREDAAARSASTKATCAARAAYLWDEEGNKYLDLLTGWGVFALGRNHPKVKAILKQLIDRDLPNLVRMDCSLLSGLAAEMLTEARRRRPVARVLLQQRHGDDRRRDQVRPLLHRPAGHRLLRPRVPRPDHRRSLALNGADFFRERFGDLMPGTRKVPFNDLPALEQALATKTGRRVHRRAGAGQELRGRRRRLPRRGPAALPQVRHAAGARRSAVRPGSNGQMVLLPALAGGRAGHRLHRQGAVRRLRPGRRGHHPAEDHGLRLQLDGALRRPLQHVRPERPGHGRGPGEPARDRGGQARRERRRDGRVRDDRACARSARLARSSPTSAARA